MHDQKSANSPLAPGLIMKSTGKSFVSSSASSLTKKDSLTPRKKFLPDDADLRLFRKSSLIVTSFRPAPEPDAKSPRDLATFTEEEASASVEQELPLTDVVLHSEGDEDTFRPQWSALDPRIQEEILSKPLPRQHSTGVYEVTVKQLPETELSSVRPKVLIEK